MHQGQGKLRSAIPTVWLMTDERIPVASLLHAVRRLPRGAAIILRHYGLEARERHLLFDQLRRAMPRGCRLLLAGSPDQARAWGADGYHGRMRKRRSERLLHSSPVHDHRELTIAVRAGADAVLISPLFTTRSHPGARILGPARFAALARRSPVPVIALGGVLLRHRGLVRRLGAHGIAAIDGLVGRRGRR